MSIHTPLELSEPNIHYLQCSLKGHNNLELKFVSKREFPNINHVYCAICLMETAEHTQLKKLEITCLDEILKESVSLSGHYMEELEPIMNNFQQKQKQIIKNDFKTMFQSVVSRREKFRKSIQNFKLQIASMCQWYEESFEKQLQADFYQSFATINSNLLSFKDTFEVLRLRLSSYSQEIPKLLTASQERSSYCQNVSKVLKDFQSLKRSSLLKTITRTLQESFSNSHIAKEFCSDRSIEAELDETMNKVISTMTEKIESLKTILGNKRKNPDSQKEKEKLEIETENKINESKEEQKEYKEMIQDKEKKIWGDPADESIEVFEREIAKLYQGDLIKRLAEGLGNNAELILNGSKKVLEELEVNEKTKEGQHKEKLNQLEEPSTRDEEECEDEEDECDEVEAHRELAEKLKKDSVQSEMVKKIFNNRKMHQKNDKLFGQNITRISEILEQNIGPTRIERIQKEDGSHSISITVTKGKTFMATNQTSSSSSTKATHNKDSKNIQGKIENKEIKNNKEIALDTVPSLEEQKELMLDFLKQLKDQIPNPEAFKKLQNLEAKIGILLSKKSKRLTPEAISAIQDFIGDALRESILKNILEQRKKRRLVSDGTQNAKFKHLCRDFFVKYYHHYKNVKCMFLEALGIPKEIFNSDYKYWVERGHTYLVWSRFKAKIQKAPVSEAKKKLSILDLRRFLNQLLYLLGGLLEEFKDDFVRSRKTDRYLLIEMLLARVYDKAYSMFEVEEEDVLISLELHNNPNGKEVRRIYEEFEKIISELMYPEMEVQVKSKETK